MDDDGIRTVDLRARSPGGEILKGITLEVRRGEILSIIGPAGAGKTTFLRSLNRLNDLDPDLRISGQVLLSGESVYGPGVNIPELRRRVSMVFAVPVPLPMSIQRNMCLGVDVAGEPEPAARMERGLKAAFLWDEVKDRLSLAASNLSGGQQQRLCLARAVALEPDVLLLDEPCSGLDPISTAKIEEALQELKKEMAIILVTNNVKQAARASDRTAFFLFGDCLELSSTEELFTNPRDRRTQEYISGVFG